MLNIAPDFICTLAPDEIFVFGSNQAGRHGLGAALVAREKFGAVSGVGQGPTGQCYAIATKDYFMSVLSRAEIGFQVMTFLRYARDNGHQKFLVTAIGCGYAGYTPREIAPLFVSRVQSIPENVYLPKSFWDVIGPFV